MAMALPLAPRRLILSALSPTSEGHPTSMAYTALPAPAGGIVLTNQNGAVLTLAGRQAGLLVAADLNGLVITLR